MSLIKREDRQFDRLADRQDRQAGTQDKHKHYLTEVCENIAKMALYSGCPCPWVLSQVPQGNLMAWI